MTKLLVLLNKPVALLKSIPEDLIAITARLAMFTVFWRSAQTKINGWDFLDQSWQFYNLSDSTFMLFQYEYDLPLISYKVAAYLGTFTEFFLSLAILLGFMTRLSALAFLGMTALIQILVYPDAWPTHIIWATALLYIAKHGPGKLSVDSIFLKN